MRSRRPGASLLGHADAKWPLRRQLHIAVKRQVQIAPVRRAHAQRGGVGGGRVLRGDLAVAPADGARGVELQLRATDLVKRAHIELDRTPVFKTPFLNARKGVASTVVEIIKPGHDFARTGHPRWLAPTGVW